VVGKEDLLGRVRETTRGGRPLPESLAAPLYLGELFFFETREHRAFLAEWGRILAEPGSRAPRILLEAFAHPILGAATLWAHLPISDLERTRDG